jgi:hypothetical protein
MIIAHIWLVILFAFVSSLISRLDFLAYHIYLHVKNRKRRNKTEVF